MTYDDQRLNQLRHGLVLLGWIYRGNEGQVAIERFDGARPAGGSRIFTVVDKKWIDLGDVSADGKQVNLNPTTGEYIGWPAFSILSTKSRAG